MLHADFAYPQRATSHDPFIQSTWKVREDEDEYSDSLPDLLALADLINDRLTKAEALSLLLHRAEYSLETSNSVTALVIAELVREALEAHEKQWGKIRQYYMQTIKDKPASGL